MKHLLICNEGSASRAEGVFLTDFGMLDERSKDL